MNKYYHELSFKHNVFPSPYAYLEEKQHIMLDQVSSETSPSLDMERYNQTTPVTHPKSTVITKNFKFTKPTVQWNKNFRLPPYIVTKPSTGQELRLTDRDVFIILWWMDDEDIGIEHFKHWPEMVKLLEMKRIKRDRKETLRKPNKTDAHHSTRGQVGGRILPV